MVDLAGPGWAGQDHYNHIASPLLSLLSPITDIPASFPPQNMAAVYRQLESCQLSVVSQTNRANQVTVNDFYLEIEFPRCMFIVQC